MTEDFIRDVLAMAGLNLEDNLARWIAIGVVYDEGRVLKGAGVDPDGRAGRVAISRAVRRELGQVGFFNGTVHINGHVRCSQCGEMFTPERLHQTTCGGCSWGRVG